MWEDVKKVLEFTFFNIDDDPFTVLDLTLIIVLLLATKLVLVGISKFYQRIEKVKKMDKGRSHSFFLITKYVVWVTIITFCLDAIGVKITLLLAGSAALLVGVGLGLQQIFNDLISGVFLLFEGTIQVGDIIEADGVVGKVEKINLRNSMVTTRENITLIIPNSRFISGNVINWSHNRENTRFSVNVGVAYGSDVDKVMATLQGCMTDHPLISNTPPPYVRFTNFGESSLDFQLLFWTKESFGIEDIKSDIRVRVNRELAKNNITIPFPQRDLHLKSSDIGKLQ